MTCPLTPRQLECVTLLADGKSTKLIADQLGISTHTVTVYLKICRDRAGVSKETALVAKAIREGWIA